MTTESPEELIARMQAWHESPEGKKHRLENKKWDELTPREFAFLRSEGVKIRSIAEGGMEVFFRRGGKKDLVFRPSRPRDLWEFLMAYLQDPYEIYISLGDERTLDPDIPYRDQETTTKRVNAPKVKSIDIDPDELLKELMK